MVAYIFTHKQMIQPLNWLKCRSMTFCTKIYKLNMEQLSITFYTWTGISPKPTSERKSIRQQNRHCSFQDLFNYQDS